MFRFTPKMTKYKLLFLLILPSLVLSESDYRRTKPRRRPQLEQLYAYDQDAQSSLQWENYPQASSPPVKDTYEEHEDFISQRYVATAAPIKFEDHGHSMLHDELDDARSPDEYVKKAIHMRHNSDGKKKLKSSSLSEKYNVIGKPVQITMVSHHQQEQPQRQQQSHVETENYPVQKAVKKYKLKYRDEQDDDHEYESFNPQSESLKINFNIRSTPAPRTTPIPTASVEKANYNANKYYTNLYSSAGHEMPSTKEPSTSSQIHHVQPVKHHVIKIVEEPLKQSSSLALPQIDKEELMSVIEKSVEKMFNEMMKKRQREESESNYRYPQHHTESTTASPKYHSKNHGSSTSSSTHFKHPKPQQQHSNKNHKDHGPKIIMVSTVKPAKQHDDDSDGNFNSQHIDLTIKNPKHRPEPIDLDALGVGQSWQHGPSFDHSAILKNTQSFDVSNAVTGRPMTVDSNRSPKNNREQTFELLSSDSMAATSIKKPKKLYITQDVYHDINALRYTPAKEVEEDDKPQEYFKLPTSVFKTENTVGASISVGNKQPANYNVQILNPEESMVPGKAESVQLVRETVKPNHDSSIDGDYRIRYILTGLAQAQAYDDAEDVEKPKEEVKSSNWIPYPMTTDPKSTGPNMYPTTEFPKVNDDLPYDSYSPKYNKNPKNEGYQDHYEMKPSPSPSPTRKPKRLIKNDGSFYKKQALHQSSFYDGDLSQSGTNVVTHQRHAAQNSHRGAGNGNSGRTTSSKTRKHRKITTELKPPPRYINY